MMSTDLGVGEEDAEGLVAGSAMMFVHTAKIGRFRKRGLKMGNKEFHAEK